MFKRIASFQNFCNESITNKKYTNVDNTFEGESYDYYQVPFELGKKNICIKGDNDYVLCMSNNYVYDYIKDTDIKNALKKDLTHIDITKDWTSVKDKSDKYYHVTAFDNKEKHILRVAKLVKEMQQGKPIKPISMFFDEIAYIHDIPNFIEDGNHRIRALQYLNYDYYPAAISGYLAKYLINYIKKNYYN